MNNKSMHRCFQYNLKTEVGRNWSMFLIALFIFSFMNLNYSLSAAIADPGSVTVKKCKDFKVTGDGSSALWKNTDWINIAQQGSGASVYSTRAKVLYSETGIYFLFDCIDKKLTATMKADFLDLFLEDVVEVFLWTDEKFPVYFEYELSPFNFELPIMVPNNNGNFLGWLPWHYEGERRTQHATSVKWDNGKDMSAWIAEFFIPYKLLAPLSNVPPQPGTKWRANMYRIDYDKGSEVPFAWQKVTGTFHEYRKFGTFIFE
jgi:hypothetical protein